MSIETAHGGAQFSWKLGARAFMLAALAPLEIIALDSLYDVNAVAGYAPTFAWLFLNLALKTAAYAALYALAAFALIVWRHRRALLRGWREDADGHRWLSWAALNLASFAALLVFTIRLGEHPAGVPWVSFSLWLAGVAIMLAPLAFALAPTRFWGWLTQTQGVAMLAAASAGAAIALLSLAAQNSWNTLAGATLKLSYAILAAFEPNAVIDMASRTIGAGGFRVIVDSYCSGYEGIGLVLGSLALFVWLFRRQLRFPHALLLFPIGGAAIWLLNAVRIAALVGIGAHFSPNIALHGFHSQAGWILFVGVTAALMAWAHASTFFRADAQAGATKRADPAVVLAIALLAPFAALMAARVVAAIFGAQAHWIAVTAMAAPLAVLWFSRRAIASLLGAVKLEAIAVGLIVGALWIATEPKHPDAALGYWLAFHPPLVSMSWLAVRVLGFALIVPFCEELAFRGYLHRALVSRRFEQAAPGAFSWLAFLATSVLFGALHTRWLAGMLAGAAYALALYRSKSLSGPIAAHIASNGVIAAYAIGFGNWGLL